jgi:hypothetical protein
MRPRSGYMLRSPQSSPEKPGGLRTTKVTATLSTRRVWDVWTHWPVPGDSTNSLPSLKLTTKPVDASTSNCTTRAARMTCEDEQSAVTGPHSFCSFGSSGPEARTTRRVKRFRTSPPTTTTPENRRMALTGGPGRRRKFHPNRATPQNPHTARSYAGPTLPAEAVPDGAGEWDVTRLAWVSRDLPVEVAGRMMPFVANGCSRVLTASQLCSCRSRRCAGGRAEAGADGSPAWNSRPS